MNAYVYTVDADNDKGADDVGNAYNILTAHLHAI